MIEKEKFFKNIDSVCGSNFSRSVCHVSRKGFRPVFYTRVPTHAVGISPSVHSPPTAATTTVATLATSGAIAADVVVVVSASHLLDLVAPLAVPSEKPVLLKEFKIYRWVR